MMSSPSSISTPDDLIKTSNRKRINKDSLSDEQFEESKRLKLLSISTRTESIKTKFNKYSNSNNETTDRIDCQSQPNQQLQTKKSHGKQIDSYNEFGLRCLSECSKTSTQNGVYSKQMTMKKKMKKLEKDQSKFHSSLTYSKTQKSSDQMSLQNNNTRNVTENSLSESLPSAINNTLPVHDKDSDNITNKRCKYRLSTINDNECINFVTSECSHCSSLYCADHQLRHKQDVQEEVNCLLGEAKNLISQISSLTIESGRKDCIEQFKQSMEIIMNEIKEKCRQFEKQTNYLHQYIETNREQWKNSLIKQIENNIVLILIKQLQITEINESEVKNAKEKLLHMQHFFNVLNSRELIKVPRFDDTTTKIKIPRLIFSNEIVDEFSSDDNSEIKEYLKQQNIDTDGKINCGKSNDSNVLDTAVLKMIEHDADDHSNIKTATQIDIVDNVGSENENTICNRKNNLEFQSILSPLVHRLSNEDMSHLEDSLAESHKDPSDLSTSANVTVGKRVSIHGNVILVVNGYSFYKKYLSQNQKKKVWRCMVPTCSLMLHTTSDDKFIRFSRKNGDHRHPIEEATSKRKKELVSTRHHGVKDRPLPQSSSFRIPTIYKKHISNGVRSLLHDSDIKNRASKHLAHIRSVGRVLIWASKSHLKLLFNSERLYIADSGWNVPPYFEQLLVIQICYKGIWMPVVHALLPDRSALTYVYLFDVLRRSAKKFNKIFNPLLIMTEIDLGMTHAIELEFKPNTVQKRCFSSFIDILFKHVEQLDSLKEHLNDPEIHSAIQHIIALALVPPQHVLLLLNNLEKALTQSNYDRLSHLFSYFRTTWLPNLSLWNVFDLLEGVINYRENYKKRFKRIWNINPLTMWTFMNSIRVEMNAVDELIVELDERQSIYVSECKNTAIEKMNRLRNLFIAKEITPKDLLDELSYLVDDFRETNN